MTITLDLSPDMEEQAQKAAKAQGKDLAGFLIDSLRQRLRHDVLPEAESSLLLEINAPLAPEARRQRDGLLALQTQRDLTPAEQDSLANLIDAVELASAKRWQRIAELAERRGLSLAEITRELQIPLP